MLNLSDNEYEILCNKIYEKDDDIKALFYALSNLLAMNNVSTDVVIDKHILSTYFWNCDENNQHFFEALLEMGIIPDITFILFSSIENRKRHITIRDINDKDLLDNKKMSFGYDKMMEYAEKNNIPYIFINGDALTLSEILQKMMIYITVCKELDFYEIQNYCKKITYDELANYPEIMKQCFNGGENEIKRL